MIDYYVFNEQVRNFQHVLVTLYACLINTMSWISIMMNI